MLSISDSQSRVQVQTSFGTRDMMAEVLRTHWQHLGVSPEFLGSGAAEVVCHGFQRARTVVNKDLGGKGRLRVVVRNVLSGGRRGHRRNAGSRVITTRATVIGNDGSVLIDRVAKVEFPSDFALVD